jgi:hypothetical protein
MEAGGELVRATQPMKLEAIISVARNLHLAVVFTATTSLSTPRQARIPRSVGEMGGK